MRNRPEFFRLFYAAKGGEINQNRALNSIGLKRKGHDTRARRKKSPLRAFQQGYARFLGITTGFGLRPAFGRFEAEYLPDPCTSKKQSLCPPGALLRS